MPLFNYSHQFELGQTICVDAGKRNRKSGFQPDSAGGHLACLLALQAGSLPAGTGWKPIFRLRNLTPQRSQNDLTTDLFRRNFSRSRQFMKRYLPFVIVAVIALATLGSGAMLYRATRPQLLTIPEDKMLSGKVDAESM